MRTFVDTNIVLYAYDQSEPEKSTVARAILSDLWRTREGTATPTRYPGSTDGPG
jgi:predicted nucleic acid-binding protein